MVFSAVMIFIVVLPTLACILLLQALAFILLVPTMAFILLPPTRPVAHALLDVIFQTSALMSIILLIISNCFRSPSTCSNAFTARAKGG